MTALLTWLCAAGAFCVFGRMIHSVATYRPTNKDSGRPPRSKLVEVTWTTIPIVIMIASGIFALGI